MNEKELEQYGIELGRAAFNGRGQLVASLATNPHLKNVQSYEQLPGAAQAAFRIMALAVAKKVAELGKTPPPRQSAPHQVSAPAKPAGKAAPAKPAPAPAPAPVPTPAPPEEKPRPGTAAVALMEKLTSVHQIATKLAEGMATLEGRVAALEGLSPLPDRIEMPRPEQPTLPGVEAP